MDRRSFLLLAGGALAYSLFRKPGLPAAAEWEFASGYGPWVDSAIDRVDPALPSRLVIFNPGNGRMVDFPVPFRVHMTVQNPRRLEQLILISKWGAEIASFDRAAGRVDKVLSAPEGRRFFGHAVWDESEDGFWVTEQDDRDFRGRIVLRGADLSARREIESCGIFPHDVQMPEPGVLAVANNGDFYGLEKSAVAGLPPDWLVSNMVWLRTATGKATRQVRFPELLGRAGASHFQTLPNGTVFVGGKTRSEDDPSVVIRIPPEGPFRILKPAKGSGSHYQGEAISFALDGDRVVWTHTKEKGVFSANRDGDVATLVAPARSRGIAAWDGGLIVSHAKKQLLLRIEKNTVVREYEGPSLDGYRWGSHLSRIVSI